MEAEETREERRRRLNRERQARWLAKPGNRERDRERGRRWHAENPERGRETKARWRATPENRAMTLLRSCKRVRECTLTLDDIRALIAPMKCSVSGVPLSWDWDGPGRNPWAPSIDRIDCSDGYHLDNVRLVSCAYNIARSDWPDSVVLEMARALTSREGG